MIRQYKKYDFIPLLDFVKSNVNTNFYFTENNRRIIITNIDTLQHILSQSKIIYIYDNNGEIDGIVLIWNSIGNNINRDYIKLNAINTDIAEKLLTSLLWNNKKELFVKINKESSYLTIFKKHKFKFLGDRGSELILKYSNGELNDRK